MEWGFYTKDDRVHYLTLEYKPVWATVLEEALEEFIATLQGS